MSAGDVCLKCGETRGAIRSERLICWDGYDELGRHRFAPWPDRLMAALAADLNAIPESHDSKEADRG